MRTFLFVSYFYSSALITCGVPQGCILGPLLFLNNTMLLCYASIIYLIFSTFPKCLVYQIHQMFKASPSDSLPPHRRYLLFVVHVLVSEHHTLHVCYECWVMCNVNTHRLSYRSLEPESRSCCFPPTPVVSASRPGPQNYSAGKLHTAENIVLILILILRRVVTTGCTNIHKTVLGRKVLSSIPEY